MDALKEKYGISARSGLIEGSYAEKALSELLGSAGIRVLKKAIEYDKRG